MTKSALIISLSIVITEKQIIIIYLQDMKPPNFDNITIALPCHQKYKDDIFVDKSL